MITRQSEKEKVADNDAIDLIRWIRRRKGNIELATQ